jgi:topoisomerase-4 subunit A
MSSTAGYGFRVQLKEFLTKNKAGKAVLSLPDAAKTLAPTPIPQTDSLLAVATLQGRLLIFPAQELPELAKGKGNKLINIPAADLVSGQDAVVAVVALNPNGELKILSGKRYLTLKSTDIAVYLSSRAKRGTLLPRGFQKVDTLEEVI